MRQALTLLVFILSQPLFAQFQTTHGPPQIPSALCYFQQQGIEYLAIDEGGLYRRFLAGGPWERIQNTYFNEAFVAQDSLLYAQGYKAYFHGSLYQGAIRVNLNTPSTPLQSLEYQPADHLDFCYAGGNAYAVDHWSGFLRLDSQGYYTTQSQGLPYSTVPIPGGQTSKKYKVKSIFHHRGIMYAGTEEGIYKSLSPFTNWSKSNGSLADQTTEVIAASGDSIFASYGNRLYLSTDDGGQWTEIYQASSQIKHLYLFGAELYLSTKQSGLFHYNPNSASWSGLNSGLALSALHSVYKSSQGLYACTNNGLMKFDGQRWQLEDHTGIYTSSSYRMASTSQALFSADRKHIYRLNQSGQWDDVTPSEHYNLFEGIENSGDTLYLSVQENLTQTPYWLPKVLYSIDQGDSWTLFQNPPPIRDGDGADLFVHRNEVYCWGDQGIFKSGDLGATWQNLNGPGQGIYDLFVFKDTLYGHSDQFFWTYDGQNWHSSRPNGFNAWTRMTGVFPSAQKIYVSRFRYGIWQAPHPTARQTYSSNALKMRFYIEDFDKSQNALFAISDSGVFSSGDDGGNWASIGQGLSGTNPNKLVVWRDTLYVGTEGAGVWKRAINDMGIHLFEEKVQATWSAYPNPTQNYLQFSGLNGARAYYEIRDLEGRLCMSGYLREPLLKLKLASGYYLLSLQQGSEISSQLIAIRP